MVVVGSWRFIWWLYTTSTLHIRHGLIMMMMLMMLHVGWFGKMRRGETETLLLYIIE